MKLYTFFTILTISLSASFLMGQSQDKKKVKRDAKNMEFYNAVVDKKDQSFEVMNAPEQWKNESYILLAISTYINVGSKKGQIHGINRKRVLLQDQNAVELFTEFYFQDSETTLITLTKKNGEEIEVNTKEAIKVSTEVPTVYSSRFQSSQSYKFAIPNLEIGDILDFTSIYAQDWGNIISYSDALSEAKPVLHQNITIDIDKKWNVYKNTFNTDAKFVFSKGKGHAFDGRPDADMNRLTLNISMLEARSDESWENVYEVEPIIKFVGIAPGHDMFQVGNDQVNEKLDITSVLKNLVANSYSNIIYYQPITGKILPKVKKVIDKKDSPKVKADACYYYLREFMNEGYYPHRAINSVKRLGETYESVYGGFTSMDEMIFLSLYTSLLRNVDIYAEVVAMMPNRMGDLSKAVTINELYYGVYLREGDTYYWPPNKNSTHFDMPYELMAGGSGQSLIDKSKMKKEDKTVDIQMKPVSAQHNKEKNKISFSLNTADYTTLVKKQMITSGFQKKNHKSLIEEFGDNMYLDFLKMYGDASTKEDLEEFKSLSQKDKKGVYEDFIQKSDKNMSDGFKAWIEEKDTKTTLLTYETISSGRSSTEPDMKVEAEYTTDGLLKKLGPNLIFDIGKNIGDQVFIEEKSKTDRKHEIYMGAARLYDYHMELEIPDGYFIENIESLNKSAQNEYCSFVSTAAIEGNKLIVTTLKSYDKTHAPKSAWNDIIKVIDEAYKFSQEKVILKKKS